MFSDDDIFINPTNDNQWLSPDFDHTLSGKVRVANNSQVPINLKKNQVVAHITRANDTVPSNICESNTPPPPVITSNFSSIKFNPQKMNIDPSWEQKFAQLHSRYADVFNNDLPGYNGKFGAIYAHVNVGESLPPQRRGRVPQYTRNLLSELQNQFDNLETMGVFAKPEDVGVYAEYVNPSFLVNKPSGGHRLVTSFGEVAKHNKPTPTLTPS